MKEPKTCPICGNKFIPHHVCAKYCSNTCAHRAKNKGVPRDGRPAGMSEVRWRIEKRRRKNPSYYMLLPGPEVMQ